MQKYTYLHINTPEQTTPCFFFCQIVEKHQHVFSFTQSSLHGVDDVRKAVTVECVGAEAAVKARVDAEHGVVQGL